MQLGLAVGADDLMDQGSTGPAAGVDRAAVARRCLLQLLVGALGVPVIIPQILSAGDHAGTPRCRHLPGGDRQGAGGTVGSGRYGGTVPGAIDGPEHLRPAGLLRPLLPAGALAAWPRRRARTVLGRAWGRARTVQAL